MNESQSTPDFVSESDANKGAVPATTSGEVVKTDRLFSEDELRNIGSFDDAMALLNEKLGAEIYDASTEIGDGFDMLENKDKLLENAFVAVSWSFSESADFRDENGNPSKFVVMRVVTSRGEKFIITDGSTGICRQMLNFTARTGKLSGLVVKGGLRKSTYKTEIRGEVTPGVTYYLNV